VRFFENGVVSLNLPIAQEALRSRASRTTHPLALHLLSSLCSAIVEANFAVDNPFLFKTKTEVVASLARHQAAHLIGSTCSCSHSMFQTKTQRHCGGCTQCIDRRFATLAAQVQSFDLSKDYVSDVFIGPRKDQLEKAIAIDYVRHGLELAQKSENELDV
jgi:Queuosine biosynthesis protein QueC